MRVRLVLFIFPFSLLSLSSIYISLSLFSAGDGPAVPGKAKVPTLPSKDKKPPPKVPTATGKKPAPSIPTKAGYETRVCVFFCMHMHVCCVRLFFVAVCKRQLTASACVV